MNFKKELKKFVGNKAYKKIENLKKELTPEKIINVAMKKVSKTNGWKDTNDYKDKENKKIFNFKGPAFNISSMINLVKGKMPEDVEDDYKIYDNNNKLVYKTNNGFTGIGTKQEITLYDNKKNKLGVVKQKSFKKCEVIYKNEKVAKFKKTEYFNEISFNTIDGVYEINYDNRKKQGIKLKKGNKVFANVNTITPKLGKGYRDLYVIECNTKEKEDEIISILLTIVIQIVDM